MRCYACNHILSKAESTRKFTESGTFTELCNQCLYAIEDRDDTLALEEGAYDEEDEDDEG